MGFWLDRECCTDLLRAISDDVIHCDLGSTDGVGNLRHIGQVPRCDNGRFGRHPSGCRGLASASCQQIKSAKELLDFLHKRSSLDNHHLLPCVCKHRAACSAPSRDGLRGCDPLIHDVSRDSTRSSAPVAAYEPEGRVMERARRAQNIKHGHPRSNLSKDANWR
jgi:hypothetical protein